MQTDILKIVEQFAEDANLSDHRVGIVLARNGRLLERLRNAKRGVWPETAEAILAAIAREREGRGLVAVHTPPHDTPPRASQSRLAPKVDRVVNGGGK